MRRPALRIAVIEPEPARAAELGQLLSDALPEYPVELSSPPDADLILMDDAFGDNSALNKAPLRATGSPPIPTIRFVRSPDGSYLAQALQAHGAEGEHPIALTMPLTESIRCLVLIWNTWQGKPQKRDQEETPAGESARLQQRLLQLQKMEAVGELAGGIAHDFNNLLLVIRSYAEMVLEESGLSSTVRHHAQEILTAARRAGDLTRELLAFSRRQPLQLKPTNLNGIIDAAIPMLSRLVGKDITVWVQLPQGLWPIQADAAQLEQVLINLASNARDAMPHGGKLLLETTNLSIEDKHAAMPPGDYVLLAVSDTGLGIPRHILPRIFEPFFTTKERGKGTGLGLASVYGIVKQSGGYIWAYSESGYGTTFKIYMPRATSAKLTRPEPIGRLAARHATNSAS